MKVTIRFCIKLISILHEFHVFCGSLLLQFAEISFLLSLNSRLYCRVHHRSVCRAVCPKIEHAIEWTEELQIIMKMCFNLVTVLIKYPRHISHRTLLLCKKIKYLFASFLLFKIYCLRGHFSFTFLLHPLNCPLCVSRKLM